MPPDGEREGWDVDALLEAAASIAGAEDPPVPGHIVRQLSVRASNCYIRVCAAAADVRGRVVCAYAFCGVRAWWHHSLRRPICPYRAAQSLLEECSTLRLKGGAIASQTCAGRL